MKTIKKICLFCEQEFDADMREHNRGNAKYCNLACFRRHMNSLKKLKKCICLNCGESFKSVNPKAKYCNSKCKQRYYRKQISTKDFKTEKLQNMLSEFSCFNCGWDKGPRDVHHIIPACEGGKNELNNLITLCPNCHRLAHRDLLSKEQLYKLLENWTISSSLNSKELDALAGN